MAAAIPRAEIESARAVLPMAAGRIWRRTDDLDRPRVRQPKAGGGTLAPCSCCNGYTARATWDFGEVRARSCTWFAEGTLGTRVACTLPWDGVESVGLTAARTDKSRGPRQTAAFSCVRQELDVGWL